MNCKPVLYEHVSHYSECCDLNCKPVLYEHVSHYSKCCDLNCKPVLYEHVSYYSKCYDMKNLLAFQKSHGVYYTSLRNFNIISKKLNIMHYVGALQTNMVKL
jgi:hypothetical protein